MSRFITAFDRIIIESCKTAALPVARVSIAIVYMWFGVLKLVFLSPATPLVQALHGYTIPFLPLREVMIALALYEMIVGVVMLIPHLERLALLLFAIHMIIVSLPLYLLPAYTWQAPLIPTLEGQYIIKNLVLIALAISIVAHIHPFQQKGKREV